MGQRIRVLLSQKLERVNYNVHNAMVSSIFIILVMDVTSLLPIHQDFIRHGDLRGKPKFGKKKPRVAEAENQFTIF
ncbi:hypothetical protein LXL04_022243 [Taraxacum kok-saghyz]